MVRGRRKLCSSNIAAETYPEITIIVPIRNENLDTILGLIDNILKLNYPKEYFEVIIVSDDERRYFEIIREAVFKKIRNKNVKLSIVRRPVNVGYKAGALNYALKFSKGEYIVVLDADSRFSSDYLVKLVKVVSESKCDAVMSKWVPSNINNSLLSEALGYVKKFVVETLFKRRFMSLGYCSIAGSGFIIKKNVLFKLGGFNEKSILEDVELGLKMLISGLKVCFCESVSTYLEVPSTFYAYKIQQERWAYGSSQLLREYFTKILRSKMSFLKKIENLTYLSQYLSPFFLIMLNVLILLLTFMLEKDIISYVFNYAFALWLLVSGSYALIFTKYFKGKMGYFRTLRILGRTAGLTFMLAPLLAFSVIKGLFNLPFKWHVTPKGLCMVSREKYVYEISFLFIFFLLTMLVAYIYGYATVTLWYILQLSSIIYSVNMLFRGKV